MPSEQDLNIDEKNNQTTELADDASLQYDVRGKSLLKNDSLFEINQMFSWPVDIVDGTT